MTRFDRCSFFVAASLVCAGCSDPDTSTGDGGAILDGGSVDGGATSSDSAVSVDAAPNDARGSADGSTTIDASTTTDAGPLCDRCIASTLTWGRDGGRACTRDSSALDPCRAFTHRRIAEGCDPPDLACTNVLLACDDAAGAIDLAELSDALAHPDVVAAFAAAPVLYGSDPRAFDGQVLQITSGGRRVEVGTDCDAVGCVPVPEGVRALRTLLDAITTQQLARAGCEVFAGG